MTTIDLTGAFVIKVPFSLVQGSFSSVIKTGNAATTTGCCPVAVVNRENLLESVCGVS